MAVVALQALLLGSGLVAVKTGGNEEDRVERVVQEAAIEQHEAFAEQFVWAAGATLVLAGLVLFVRRPGASRVLASAVVAATLAVAGLGLRVGHAGGQLVYVHGAAAAYTAKAQASTAAAADVRPDRDDDEAHRK